MPVAGEDLNLFAVLDAIGIGKREGPRGPVGKQLFDYLFQRVITGESGKVETLIGKVLFHAGHATTVIAQRVGGPGIGGHEIAVHNIAAAVINTQVSFTSGLRVIAAD